MIKAGDEIPSVKVARLEGDLPVAFDIRDIVHGHKTLLFGVPQAFTPVCSKQHIPGIIDELPRLKAAGFDQFIILAPDNPWAMAAWKEHFSEAKDVLFLSDGNSAFLDACGLKESCAGLFLGDCSKRFAMQVHDLVVTDLSVEDSILVVKCASADAQVRSTYQEDDELLIELIDE